MKKKIAIIVLGILILFAWANAGATNKPANCPDGFYLQGYDKSNGNPVCSPPPTGCPYAERIPKDSPKCVPPAVAPPVQTPAIETPEPLVEEQVFYGK